MRLTPVRHLHADIQRRTGRRCWRPRQRSPPVRASC